MIAETIEKLDSIKKLQLPAFIETIIPILVQRLQADHNWVQIPNEYVAEQTKLCFELLQQLIENNQYSLQQIHDAIHILLGFAIDMNDKEGTIERLLQAITFKYSDQTDTEVITLFTTQLTQELLNTVPENERSKAVHFLKLYTHKAPYAWLNSSSLNWLHKLSFNPRVANYFKDYHAEGVPFTDYECDPEHISQIKKLINALHYARLAFSDLEKIEIDFSSPWAKKQLFDKIIPNAYQACHLLTHLDIELTHLFSQEIHTVLSLLNQFYSHSGAYLEKVKHQSLGLANAQLHYKAGEIAGIAADQIRPINEPLDYSYLTQFSAVLPGYIEQLTQYIKQFSSPLSVQDSKSSQVKLQQLQETSLYLLNDIEKARLKSPFMTVKLLRYIRIIRHLINLSTSIVTEIGKLNESSQDSIRYSLAQLKYEVLPNLFELVDKVECNTMLIPGTLSAPLMKKIKSLYQYLTHYCSMYVQFDENGPELLSIEDARFNRLRSAHAHKKIQNAHKNLFYIQQMEQYINDFYRLLDKNDHIELLQLPPETKKTLLAAYKEIQPYMVKIDMQLDEHIIYALTQSNQDSYLNKSAGWIGKAITRARGDLPFDHVRPIQEKKKALMQLLAKKRATQHFQIQLNEDLLSTLNRTTEVSIFPYTEEKDIFMVDESTLLAQEFNHADLELKFHPDNSVANVADLNSEHALSLALYYQSKQQQATEAQKIYLDFKRIIDNHSVVIADNSSVVDLNKLNRHHSKAHFRRLYAQIQSCLIQGLPLEHKQAALDFDKYLVSALSDKTVQQGSKANMFDYLHPFFEEYINKIHTTYTTKSTFYAKLAEKKYQSEHQACEYKPGPPNSRKYHLIQHTKISENIAKLKQVLYDYQSLFNQAIQQQLETKAEETPFPELYNGVLPELAQGKQVLALKRLFNGLYDLENIALQLEQLNDTSTQIQYIYTLGNAYGHLHSLMAIINQLAGDEHFNLISGELIKQAQKIFTGIKDHSKAYLVGANEVPYAKLVTNNVMWYGFNAFYYLPQHIQSATQNNAPSPETVQALQIQAKKATTTIEEIIANSNSSFQLFLKTPQMYRWYNELKRRMTELSTVSHHAVMDNIKTFHAQLFTPLLLEADLKEDVLGLKPGLFTEPLKNIIDTFFKGLLYSLNLDSKTHIDLVCSKSSFEERLRKSIARQASTQQQLAELEADAVYFSVRNLHQMLLNYDKEFSRILFWNDDVLKKSKFISELIDQYNNIRPNLVLFKDLLQLDTDLETPLIQTQIVHNELPYQDIKKLVFAIHNLYLGKKSTLSLSLKTASEKIAYLNGLSAQQDSKNRLFIQDYTAKACVKQIEALSNRYVGLQYTDKEYNKKLLDYLMQFKEELIEETQKAEEINIAISRQLQEYIEIFEKRHYAEHHQLDAIHLALTQFKQYFARATLNSASFGENEHTLKNKGQQINLLVTIAENKELSIRERLVQIQKASDPLYNPNFKRIILAQEQASFLSLTYLKQCWLSLLEALYLYTSDKKQCFNNMMQTINTPAQESELVKKLGLFAQSYAAEKVRAYNNPPPEFKI